MKKSKAARNLRALLRGVQRLRSITAENGIIVNEAEADKLQMTTAQAARVWPWVWGEKCIIDPLVKILDRYDDKAELDPLAFFNMVYVATSLEPMLSAVAYMQDPDCPFPEEADINWLRGFDAE